MENVVIAIRDLGQRLELWEEPSSTIAKEQVPAGPRLIARDNGIVPDAWRARLENCRGKIGSW
jgi:hypothetical protein